MWSQHARTNYACFSCRRHGSSEMYCGDASTVICTSCREPMTHMGRNFKAPRRTATKQWEKVRRLREQSCYFICHDRRHLHAWSTEPFVKTLSDAKNRLQQRRSDRKPPLEPEKVPKRSHFGYKVV